MKKTLAASIISSCSFLAISSASASSVDYSGVLSNAPVYHRPSYTNPYTPAFNCVDCGYQAEAILVSATGSYTFTMLASSFADQVGILYAGGFDPTAPMTDFVGPYSHATYLSGHHSTVSLSTGVQYYWVTSTDFGFQKDGCAAGCTFTTNVSGPGAINLGVPEPSTWALMLVGFGGLGVALRSRRRLALAQA
jgi:hypothetical protein